MPWGRSQADFAADGMAGFSIMPIRPLDRHALQHQPTTAKPFPFVRIDGFLDLEFAREVSRSYPGFRAVASVGRTLATVDESRKRQITDRAKFPAPVACLNEALRAPEFLDLLADVTGAPHTPHHSDHFPEPSVNTVAKAFVTACARIASVNFPRRYKATAYTIPHHVATIQCGCIAPNSSEDTPNDATEKYQTGTDSKFAATSRRVK